ncbi:hypothetical protein Poly51_07250 [Rubripirellula tenax]|uniref:Peptidase C39 family protein n=1 Tax=Rubripirellula tenax TaxID=2528015 RepID=A0A5C6FK57_9BACT|nr:peptidase C39 [Rubripirellula tenax]TWU60449.1 hypothetical protein Poly51_07250 [Rubripirellula tenax]
MSTDLVIGVISITGLSVLAYHLGRCTGLKSPGRRQLWFLLSLFAALSFAWTAAGNLLWASIVPHASVVFWANGMPVLLSLTAGIASTMVSLGGWHRPATVVAMMVLTAGYTLIPVMRPVVAPAKTDAASEWRDGICLQSHPSTCAAAAGATLLRFANVDANEAAMVTACLTSSMGTEPLGLFRGLSIATTGQTKRPAVASSDPSTWRSGDQLPNIALVEFRSSHVPGSPRRFFGPTAEGHAVVIQGRDRHGNWIVMDPAFGRTLWSDTTFRKRFTGDAIYLK